MGAHEVRDGDEQAIVCVFLLEAKLHGERELRLHQIAAWRESTPFDQRERALLDKVYGLDMANLA